MMQMPRHLQLSPLAWRRGGRLLVAAMLTAGAAAAFGQAAASGRDNRPPPVRICVGNFPPYNSPQLPRMGPVFDLAQQVFQRMGYTVQADFMPWARIIKDGEEGHCLILGIWRNAARDQIFDYSAPLLEQELGFFARLGSQHPRDSAEALQQLRIGVERGTYLPELLRAPSLQFDTASSLNGNLRKLARERIDLAFGAKDAGLYMLARDSELQARVTWLDPALESKPTYLAFSRRTPEAAALRAAFDQGLQAMKNDGSYRRLLRAAKLTPLP